MKHDRDLTDQTLSQDRIGYFRKRRVAEINKYHAAEFWNDRISARENTLHYGKLIRKLEAPTHARIAAE